MTAEFYSYTNIVLENEESTISFSDDSHPLLSLPQINALLQQSHDQRQIPNIIIIFCSEIKLASSNILWCAFLQSPTIWLEYLNRRKVPPISKLLKLSATLLLLVEFSVTEKRDPVAYIYLVAIGHH